MKKTSLGALVSFALLLPLSSHAGVIDSGAQMAAQYILLPVFENNGTANTLNGYLVREDGKEYQAMDWIPDKGRVTVTEDYMEVTFKFSQKALDFFNQRMKGSDERMPIALEIDLTPDKKNALASLGRVEQTGNIPGETAIVTDTTTLDAIPGYGLIIREPQRLKAGEIYSVRFYPPSGQPMILKSDANVRLTYQVSVETGKLTALLSTLSVTQLQAAELTGIAELLRIHYRDANKDAWKYLLAKSNGFNPIGLKSGASICWYKVYSDDPGCAKGGTTNQFLFSENSSSSLKRVTDTVTRASTLRLEALSPLPASPGGVLNIPEPPKLKPDLKVNKIWLTDESEKNTKTSFLRTEKLKMKAQFANTGDANPKKDMEVHFYLSKGLKEDSHGDWKRVGTDNIKKENLKVGDTHTETEGLELWDDVPGVGTYNIVACIDHPNDSNNNGGDIDEKSESNNCSNEAVFEVTEPPPVVEVPKKPDLVITSIGTGGNSSVKKGNSFSPALRVVNIGTANLAQNIRSAYYLKGPSTGNVWAYIDSDESTTSNLKAGSGVNEEIKKGIKINTKGTYTLKACADYTSLADELDENNNCAESSAFAVN